MSFSTIEIKEIIEKKRIYLKRISDNIFTNPEVCFEEFESSKLLAEYLSGAGFKLQYPYCNFDTAFRADFGYGKKTFCIMCEYDALPGIGHACGHHLIATAGIAAALAAKEIMLKYSIPGKVTVLGTPAEEGGGGKIKLINAGGFNDIDACILCHPGSKTGIDPGDLAISRFSVEFLGKAAHAAAAPDQGINALDAMNLLFAGINAWRQQIPDSSRIHGIITRGGNAANIIPAFSSGNFYLRSLDNDNCKKMEEHFENIVKGAALMTACKYNCTELGVSYQANRVYPEFEKYVEDRLFEAGFKPELLTQRFSTDYGNVSQLMPGCNFFFSICKQKANIALHSEDFKKISIQPYAFEQCLRAGQVMAWVALEFFQNKIILKEHTGT